jgi:aminoglycoside phosphotransferase (APT) family kinase protein
MNLHRHHNTPMAISRSTVKKIILHLLNETPIFVQKLNNGVTNKVYKVVLKSDRYLIVRISPSTEKINHYLKEQWCCNEVRRLGVPVPEILEVGNSIVPYPYMVATEVYGIPGNLYEGDRSKMFYQMGKNALKIHRVKTNGFGEVFDWSSNVLSKNVTWKDFVDKELGVEKILEYYSEHKIITDFDLKKLKTITQRIMSLDFEPYLCHSDLLPKNVIVNKAGALLSIIDWEGSRSGNGKLWDLAVTLPNITDEESHLFLKGYGMNSDEFKEIQPLVYGFYVLRKHDMVEVHITKNELKPLASLKTKFSKLLEKVSI